MARAYCARKRLVGLRVAIEQHVGGVEEAEELRLDQVVAELKLGWVNGVVIGARGDELAELRQALLRHRVGLQIGVDALDAEQLAGHCLEGLEHAAARLMGGVEEAHARLVGRGFLVLTIGEDAPHGRILPAIGDAHAGLPDPGRAAERAGSHGREPEQLEHQRCRLRPRQLRAEPREMASGDMAALMRDDADHLVRRLGLHQRAGMDEHIVPVDDEGIEAPVVDDVDLDRLRAETRSGENRLGIGADQSFGLGVADQPRGVGRGRAHENGGKPSYQPGAKPPRRSIGEALSQSRHGRLIV